MIPFPRVQGFPEGCGNTNHLPSPDLSFPFYYAAKQLRRPFGDVLKEMCNSDSSTPICVTSDMFLPWTHDSCRMFNIPRIVCGGMASVPFPIHKNDSPGSVRPGDDNNPMRAILAELLQANHSSWGTLVNSFEELEEDQIVQPLLLLGHIKQDLMNSGPHNDQKQYSPHIKWLEHEMEEVVPGNVIYVAFGSQSYMTDVQMEEIALGLEKAGQPFIWVVRSSTWIPPVGWKKRIRERGLGRT
ncbi:scopoletin glucosyltransferase-like [Populus nigra]|uniref:scopoletin glucosyltransferase-like n=1 Tax=Populus nigra TaxID=3691 RepID=UPI002B269A97|nr:scopoletin glucosyltransferase-like [Populus nigra]